MTEPLARIIPTFVISPIKDPKRAVQEVADRMKRAVYETTQNKLLPALKAAAPGTKAKRFLFVVKTSETASSISLGIKPDAKHMYLLYTLPPGTPPHVIRPARKKALSFVIKDTGERIFSKYVLHPGYRPSRDWAADAMDETKFRQYVIEAYKAMK